MLRCFSLLVLLAVSAAPQAQTIPPAGSDDTFDVATWNIEWFGSSQFGPSNESLQQANVADVIAQSEVDVWALQEIASSSAFDDLLGALGPDWAGMRAPSGADQRLAFVYREDAVQVFSLEEIEEGMDSFDFAGRLPYQLHVQADTNTELYILTVHMKAGDTSSDYSRRVNASQQLKAYTDDLLAGGAGVVILGDLNDELLESISGNPFSPYANFLADDDYAFLTEPFDQPGDSDDENTYCAFYDDCEGSFASVIDHIILSQNVVPDYLDGSVGRYTALLDAFDAFGGEFVDTTSDHLPVFAQFSYSAVANEPDVAGRVFGLGAPYPNPFTDAATLSYTLDRTGPVRLELFDALGRRMSVIEDEARPAGTYRVRFNGDALPPGLYVVRLTAGDQVATRRLVRGT
ncbi:MAG: endonuclease/exonuclease/phosphatase family protein [Rubricoccaceae bacterium]|nr:endonuclease/exonuclease/phosphatase family protein [Rubricoccaceae bacterium]